MSNWAAALRLNRRTDIYEFVHSRIRRRGRTHSIGSEAPRNRASRYRASNRQPDLAAKDVTRL
jgi:hypothetical protein